MYKKNLIIGITLLLSVSQCFSQDSAKKNDNPQATLSQLTDPNSDSAKIERNLDKPHAVINLNSATAAPGTTSGTLGSSVSPNTEFVIPFGGKKKANKNASEATNAADGK